MNIDLSTVYLSMNLAYSLDGLLVEVSRGTMVINTHDDAIQVHVHLKPSLQ
jgi:hypothetical protein